MELYENARMEEDTYEVADSDQVVSNSQVEVEVSASPAEELGDEEEVYDVVGDPRRSAIYKYTNPPTSTSEPKVTVADCDDSMKVLQKKLSYQRICLGILIALCVLLLAAIGALAYMQTVQAEQIASMENRFQSDSAAQLDQQTANVSQELRESFKLLLRKQENTLVTLENRTSAFEEALANMSQEFTQALQKATLVQNSNISDLENRTLSILENWTTAVENSLQLDLLEIKQSARALLTTVQNNNRTLGSDIDLLRSDISEVQAAVLGIMPASIDYCDFESGLCAWLQPRTDDFDWTRYRGSTPSTSTGPSADHTLGTGTGYYLYIEASGRTTGDMAILESAMLDPNHVSRVQFYYNMYGDTMGTLTLYTKSSSGVQQSIWSRTGNQGYQWFSASVDIVATSSYQLVFEGIRGTDFQSDIAIDDISLIRQ